jgi:hypothetical protein
MPHCQFHVFCCFCVSKKLHKKYSRNWMKQKPKFLFFLTWDGVQSRDGREPGANHTIGWRGPSPGPRHQVVWPPGPPPDAALLPIYSPRRENPKDPINFPENIPQAVVVIDARLGGSRSSSRHPVGDGNHHRRPSSSPCLPPEWCVSSRPWTGSIAVARWLSSPPCASCLDIVSCLSWSRSSLCNSTCCVCWDLMNIEYYVELIYWCIISMLFMILHALRC